MAQEEVVVTEAAAAAAAIESPKKPAADEKPDAIASPVKKSGSFKEESNLASDLQESEKKSLDELKSLIQADFAAPPPVSPALDAPAAPLEEADAQDKSAVVAEDDGAKTVEAIESTVVPVIAVAEDDGAKTVEAIESTVVPVIADKINAADASIWGVPLLNDKRSDTVLLKFLRARDFKAKEAMAMVKNTIKWRSEFEIEKLMEEDLGVSDMEKAVFMSGVDKQGHPVCYNVYGEFQSKEMYDKAFGDEEKRQRFLRWRIQYLEKGIRELLDFKPDGVSTMVQVTDLKNSPGLMKGELRQALVLLQDNYPEFVAKQIFINVPWWYLAFNRMISPFLTQRTKSKFVFAGPSKSADTLFSYISPEQVPVQFGGLKLDNDSDFATSDAVTEVNMKPSSKQIIEIPVTEKCLLVWELRVLGWDVTLGAEFVPNSADSYTVIVQKSKKMTASDEAVVNNSFKIGEPGKVVITVDNATSKKKKLLYRYKVNDSADSY